MPPRAVAALLSVALLLATIHAGAVSAAGLVEALGYGSSPGGAFRLLRLSGGAGGGEAPWETARAEGNAYFKAGEWAIAAGRYTHGLACDSPPPEAAAALYSNRAAALLKLGSFVEAGADARAGLALFDGSESLPGKLKQKLTVRAGDADRGAAGLLQKLAWAGDMVLGAAVEQAAAHTREVSTAAQTTIEAKSPLGIALGDLNTTAYFFESQFRELRPGSKHRFLATVKVYTCIAVLASSPGGWAFGAHVNPISLSSSYAAISGALQSAFRGVDRKQVTIRLVGGHTKMDMAYKDFLQKHCPGEEALFSAVVRKCVAEALPGAAIDTSLLNRFEGAGAADGGEADMKCHVEGQLFQVVALDSHTGSVVTHTKFTAGEVWPPVPKSVRSHVLDESVRGIMTESKFGVNPKLL